MLDKRNKMSKKEEYIQKAKILHNNKYDYSLIEELFKRDMRVKIICDKHGIFEQSFHKHLSGDGCKKCGIEKIAMKKYKLLETNLLKKQMIYIIINMIIQNQIINLLKKI